MTARTLQSASPVLLLTPLFVRASVPFSPLPGWDTDPMLTSDPSALSVLGPAGSIGLDLLVFLGAALWSILNRRALRAERLSASLSHVATVAGGCALPIILLAAFTGWSIHDYRIALAWLSAGVAAFTIASAARNDPSARALVAAVTLGFIALLAARAGTQFLVEHPLTVADFQANKEQILQARGWTADSASARAYERRLTQPDASAWFALSNVLAGLSAASTIAFLGLLAAALRAKPLRSPALLTAAILGTALSAAALYFAFSKGGLIALAAGLGAITLIWLALSPRWPTRRLPIVLILGLGTVLAPIALIIARGLAGETALGGELSLYFRWFYLQGASGIFTHYPISGVGPDGFQQAFLLTKPALCPEDPSSAHSILFDWAATLGIAGLILGLALLLLTVLITASPFRAASTPVRQPPLEQASVGQASRLSAPPITLSLSSRLPLLIPALATLLAAWIESPGMSPTAALARVAGLIGWCLLAWLLYAPLTRAFTSADPRTRALTFAAFSAAAITLIAHAQIEVTFAWVPSVGLAALFLGIAWWRTPLAERPASRAAPAHSAPLPTFGLTTPKVAWLLKHGSVAVVYVWLVVVLLFVFKGGPLSAIRVELNARSAARLLEPLGEANSQLADLQRQSASGDLSPSDTAAALDRIRSNLRNSYVATSPPALPGDIITDPLQRELCRATIALGFAAADRLTDDRSFITDWRTVRALAELRIRIASAAQDAGAGQIAYDQLRQLEYSTFKAFDVSPDSRDNVDYSLDPPEPNEPRRMPLHNVGLPNTNVPILRTRSLILLAMADLRERTTRADAIANGADPDLAARSSEFIILPRLNSLRCLKKAHLLDPTNPDHPARAAELAAELAATLPAQSLDPRNPRLTPPTHQTAAKWAALALELNKNTRLDPLGRALSEARLTRLRELTNQSE